MVRSRGRVSDPLATFRRALAGAPDPPPVRRCYAAARVVMLPSYEDLAHAPDAPGSHEEIHDHVDWDATRDQRARLDSLGFGVAEAMDSAQRFEVGWPVARSLVELCGGLALGEGFVAGACADHLDPHRPRSEIVDGVVHQAGFVRSHGGVPILLPLPHLARGRAGEEEVVAFHDDVLRQVEGPLLLHWLGEAFAPELAGYFPGRSFLRVMRLHPDKLRGAKLSLLDPRRERELRDELLPTAQAIFTGDDLSFVDLVEGDGSPPAAEAELDGRPLPLGRFSHALLGILEGVAEQASLALRFLTRGERETYRELLLPCQELSRAVFAPPVPMYRARLAFLSWREGRQANAMTANHHERLLDATERSELAALAVAARGILPPPPAP